MDVVDFYPKTFQQIPEQDNPALNGDDQECIMIVASNLPTEKGHAIVLRIEFKGEPDAVTSMAKFWRHDLAVEYCKFIRGTVQA